MIKQKLLFMILPIFLIGACTDNGLLFRSFGSYDKKDEGGVYKVGMPYQVKGIWYTPREDYGYSEKGMASWYEPDQDSFLTDNGEMFSADQMTARHRTLPLPSLVRITNLENGNTAIVRVNDRGPYVHNRLIDVSHKAAEALEFQETGTTMVQVDILPDESRSMKEQLIQMGRYVDDSDKIEELPVSDEVLPLSGEQLSETPIYQPDQSQRPLYAPVSVEKLPTVEQNNAVNQQDAEVAPDLPLTDEKQLPENKVLYGGNKTGEATAADQTESSVTTPASPIDSINQGEDTVPLNDQAVDESSDQTDSIADTLVQAARRLAKPVDTTPQPVADLAVSDEKSNHVIDQPTPPETTDQQPVDQKPAQAVDLTQPIVKPTEPVNFQHYFIQAGAFSKAENAVKAEQELTRFGSVKTHVKTVSERELTIVRVGPFQTPDEARSVLDKIQKAGYGDARIISQ